MDLSLRVEGVGIRPTTVAVTLVGAVSGRQLTEAIGQHLDVRRPPSLWWWDRTGTALDRVDDITSLEPRDGDVVVIASNAGDRPTRDGSDRVGLQATSGPDAGRNWVISPGRTTIGRDATNDVVIAGDTVSRNHCRIVWAEGVVTIEDLRSSNGTFIDGKRITTPRALADGSVVELGESRFVVHLNRTEPATAPRAETRWSDGTLLLNRPPRHLSPNLSTKITLPAPPANAAKRPFPVIALVMPLVMAVVMFAVLSLGSGTRGMAWMSLLFGLMSPLMMLGNYVSERRQGGKSSTSARADYDREFASTQAELTRLAARSVQLRHEQAPDPVALASWATSLSPRLWERRPRDLDFAELRVGLADRPTLLEVVAPETSRENDQTAVDRNRALVEEFAVDRSVPVTIGLDQTGVVGLHGETAATSALLRSLLLQLATLHSPADVALIALVPPELEDELAWMRWLPHCATLSETSSRTILPVSRAIGVFDLVDEIIAARRAALEQHASVMVRLPRVVLVLPEVDLLPAARLNRILMQGPSVGILALTTAGSAPALPGECQAVVAVRGREGTVSWPLLGESIADTTIDSIDVADCTAAAIAMSALRDPSGTREAGIPRSASYEEISDFDMMDPVAIRTRWADPDPSLSAPIGLTASGVFSVSLRRDGPHAVVAGTTGAGKSEFLQTLLASLAAHHSPERLAFVLIDLKGGAAFQDLARLPHTVGFFTDLDEHLSERALRSLNAELRRREELLSSAGVKDLIEFERRDPGRAPPSLLIAFDEFAVIKTEMPDFIEGIVDIARRGRSLGVHMILATQSPTGVVDHHIRANTNLRVALRTANGQESQEIIERASAAEIPRTAHGRGWVRIGQDEPVLVQTAFSGRHSTGNGDAASVQIRAMGLSGPVGTVHLTTSLGVETPTDAQRLIDAALAAAESGRIAPGRAPWLPPLPATIAVEDLHIGELRSGSLAVAVGLLDEPDRQSQATLEIDLAADGNLAVYGASGSGKTTVVRTLIAGLTRRYAPEECGLVIIDFASRGLRPLETLPHVVAYVTDDDPALLERVFARLDREIATRREILTSLGRASLAEAHVAGEVGEMGHIVVLVDGLVGFVNAHEDLDAGAMIDDLVRLAAEGRSSGVHLMVTSDRRNGVPMNLAAGISERIVLRMTDVDDYLWLGVPEARGVSFGPGRGVVAGRGEVQVAVPGGEPEPRAQNETIIAAARHGARPPTRVEAVASSVSHHDAGSGPVPLAIDALTDETVTIDLDDLRWFLVTGPDRSGRSSTLGLLAEAWMRRHPGADAYLVAPRRSPLRDRSWSEAAMTPESASDLGRRIASRLGDGGAPTLLVIDDGDLVAEGQFDTGIDQLFRVARDLDLVVIAAAQSRGAARTFSGWLRDLRDARNGLLLCPDIDRDGDVFGGRIPRRSARTFPTGRGYLVAGDEHRFVHVVTGATSMSE